MILYLNILLAGRIVVDLWAINISVGITLLDDMNDVNKIEKRHIVFPLPRKWRYKTQLFNYIVRQAPVEGDSALTNE